MFVFILLTSLINLFFLTHVLMYLLGLFTQYVQIPFMNWANHWTRVPFKFTLLTENYELPQLQLAQSPPIILTQFSASDDSTDASSDASSDDSSKFISNVNVEPVERVYSADSLNKSVYNSITSTISDTNESPQPDFSSVVQNDGTTLGQPTFPNIEKIMDFLNNDPAIEKMIEETTTLNLRANEQLKNELTPAKFYPPKCVPHVDTEDEDEVFDAPKLMDDSLD